MTARHVVEGIKSGDHVSILHDSQWKAISVRFVGAGENDVDITVLSPPKQISHPYPLEASTDGIEYAQQCYFLGFPFGWDGGVAHISNGYPIPFVKSGIISAFIPGDATKIYIDAHGNKGFSGGPAVFVPDQKSRNSNPAFKLAGVVVNYPTPRIEPIVTPTGEQVLDRNGNSIGVRENPGFVVAIDIRHAVDLIDQNPIGTPLPAGQTG